ncbi:MAG: hypothetical protein KA333_02005, partial [Moraxella sp.]|nr:hypothetical protein [Moraxella sp.]
IKIHAFPKDYKVQLFRVVVNENRTDWIVTNDTTQDSSDGTRLTPAVKSVQLNLGDFSYAA